MGRQVCIRVTHGDLVLLENELRSRGARFVRYYQPASGELKLAPTIDRAVTKEPLTWLTREADLPRIRVMPVPNQPYRLIDQVRAPVIELSLGQRSPGPVSEGRLYVRTARQRLGDVSTADEEFDAWADGVLRWVRHAFAFDPRPNAMTGRKPAEAQRTGAAAS